MVEPVTSIGMAAVAAYLGRDAVQKLLGPTADYLGHGLRDFTEKRADTIVKIFKRAESRLGDRIESPGVVPPKVLKGILVEGSFCDDNLAVEYLGGILASSRTGDGRDDRGARILKTVDGMSTYQLRTHYLMYGTIHTLFAGRDLPFDPDGRSKMQVFAPFSGYLGAMDLSASERDQLPTLLPHIFYGLHGDEMLGPGWLYGVKEKVSERFAGATEGGVIFGPSSLGIELFLWAFGHSEKPHAYLLSVEFSPIVEGLRASIVGARATRT